MGRAATGLSTNDPDFAILPPHFNTTKGPVISVQEWEDILPGYETYYPQQRVWTSGIMERLKQQVQTGVFRNEETKMMATGIPPYAVLCNRMHELERGVDSRLEDVMQEIQSLPSVVTSCILD